MKTPVTAVHKILRAEALRMTGLLEVLRMTRAEALRMTGLPEVFHH